MTLSLYECETGLTKQKLKHQCFEEQEYLWITHMLLNYLIIQGLWLNITLNLGDFLPSLLFSYIIVSFINIASDIKIVRLK